MDFFKRKETLRIVTACDLAIVGLILVISTERIVDGVLRRYAQHTDGNISTITMVRHVALWFGLFALHVVPACTAFGLYRVANKGRDEILEILQKCKSWLKSTLYLLIALVVMFVLFALDSDVQSYLGAGTCAMEFLIRVFFRCFVQAFKESISGSGSV